MHTIFVYGTLKRGGKWHHLLENEDFIGEDSIKGEMYLEKAGYYPILFEGKDEIPGEVYQVSQQAYADVVALEEDADYLIKSVKTQSGREVEVFFFQDKSQKIPTSRISSFDAKYFNQI